MEVDWLNINPLSGGTGQTEIYAYVTENGRIGSNRTAKVRFTNEEGLYADLNLSQSSNTEDMRFVVTPNSLSVPSIGGTYYVNILTNTYWRVSDYASGLTITSDNEEGFGDGILTIVFPVNPLYQSRTGYITITSLMGTERIYWEQAAYNAITVIPDRLIFPQTGGSLTVTVNAYNNWSITAYDSASTSFSVMSGTSGETTVTVTKAGLTETERMYYVTKPVYATFSDGITSAVLSLENTIDDYYIDDDWVTVVYDVPSANTEVAIYGYERDLAVVPTVSYQDNNHTGHRTQSEETVGGRYVLYHYITFTTAGKHTIKYKFNIDGVIIPWRCFCKGNPYIDSITIGNKCAGAVEACAAYGSGAKEVILGLGNISLIGEYAFYGCGSNDRDFILGSNVQSYIYQPFHKMKARRFVYDRADLGGTGNTTSQSVSPNGAVRKFIISGSTNSWGSSNTVTGTTSYCSWSSYPGDISCGQLVIGQNVRRIHNTPFYPYGIRLSSVSSLTCSALYQYASTTFYGTDSIPDSRIVGWTVPSIAFVNRTSPSVDTYTFTPKTQTFTRKEGDVSYGTFATYTKGPQRNIPFHYPTGADYSAWSNSWSNMIGDLDL